MGASNGSSPNKVHPWNGNRGREVTRLTLTLGRRRANGWIQYRIQDEVAGLFFFSFFFCFTLSRFLSFFPANLHHALGLMSLAIDPLRPMPQAGEALKENSQKTSTKRHEFGHSVISYSANLGHVTIEMSFSHRFPPLYQATIKWNGFISDSAGATSWGEFRSACEAGRIMCP